MSILRQRRLFFIMAMISILACVNWLMSTRKFESIQIFENKKQISSFSNEKSTGQQNEDLNTFPNSIETTNTQSETTSNEIFTEIPKLLILKRLNLEDFIDILKLLHTNKVSLLDIGILENIKISKSSNHSITKVNLLKTLKLNTYFITSTKFNQFFITFGTSYLGFGKLYKVIKQFNITYESKLRIEFFERS